MSQSTSKAGRPGRLVPVVLTFLIVMAVGFVDYATGYEISFAVFYLLAISVALWYVGPGFALFVSALSIVSWLVGDWAAGARYHSPLVPAWNATITMMFYLIVVVLLSKIKGFQETLETRVRERTAALMDQMAERERLEKEILDVSEREQRRFGHDLHDGLCQHLLGVAIAGQVLVRRLELKSAEDSGSAGTIVRLVEEAILMARKMSHGLSPLERGPEGLVDALDALAASTRELFNVDCNFHCPAPAPVIDPPAAMHLYRIAQESISNAVRHGRATRVEIELSINEDWARLSVRDNGGGLPATQHEGNGMGLRIMKHRASMIGADFDVAPRPQGGVVVTCSIPQGGAGAGPHEV
ncbi:MAG: sensor histidine kinase [Chthoniobacteraceae bacterium]|jgi:signal transduction histidine kinase